MAHLAEVGFHHRIGVRTRKVVHENRMNATEREEGRERRKEEDLVSLRGADFDVRFGVKIATHRARRTKERVRSSTEMPKPPGSVPVRSRTLARRPRQNRAPTGGKQPESAIVAGI